MTQPQQVTAVHPAVAAIQHASLTALAFAVVAVALIGTDAAVAVARTARSSSPAAGQVDGSHPGAPVTPGVTAAPTTPASPATPGTRTRQRALKALLADTLAKAVAQHTVHSVARNVSKKGVSVFVDDDARNGGIQRISIYGGHIQIRVVGSTTYFTGDRRGLEKYFSFSAPEVTALGKQWIPLVSGQAGYKAVTEGVTIASTLSEDRIIGHLRREPDRTLDGQPVFGISGRATGAGAPHHADATMWINSSTGLPVEFDAANGDQQLTQSFSAWGRPIHLESPANVAGQNGLSS
ncbi:MAG TPA: hypothetical protein VHV76_02745 [Mycobacteriales bacterium]|nr:hypothetical protein [Mycobacteriales bacterium]